ncbi:hypothetical protein D3C78_1547650 [compost metagenome]
MSLSRVALVPPSEPVASVKILLLSSCGSTVIAPARTMMSPASKAWAKGAAMARASREALRVLRIMVSSNNNKFLAICCLC